MCLSEKGVAVALAVAVNVAVAVACLLGKRRQILRELGQGLQQCVRLLKA